MSPTGCDPTTDHRSTNVNGDTRWRRRLIGAALASTLALAIASTGRGEPAHARSVATATTTTAEGGTWCNEQPIPVPSVGAGHPYPSTITVDTDVTVPTVVTVDLLGVTHTYPNDLDVMLASPTGRTLVLMSDAGGGIDVTDVDLSFSDFAVNGLPDDERITTSTYLPSNFEGADSWPDPAPPDSGATALAAFNGADPNGTWSLYVIDGAEGDQGRIDGWCVSVASGTPTATSLASSANPSPHGTEVVFTATVTTDGSPVTEGSVTFSDGATVLGTVPVGATGMAALTTAELDVGPHRLTARFSDDSGTFATSRSSVRQFVDAPTSTPAAGRWCNSGPIRVPESGPAEPYPSGILVSGAGSFTTRVSVQLRDVIHEASGDLDVMVVGPTGQHVVLMSDAGDDEAVGVDLTFSDQAARGLPDDDVVSSGTYRPTDVDDGDSDPWMPPAPSESSATTLATFNRHNPNGTWRLFVLDDSDELGGWIDGGWCLGISVDNGGPQARPTASPAPDAAGWNHGDVTVTWNWSDDDAGVDRAHCSARTIFGGEGQRRLSATCRDRAGNETTATRTVRVDTRAPAVTINRPTGRSYVQGTVVRARFACADRTSGIATCSAPVAAGARIDTFVPGRHRFTVTARDRAGNRSSATIAYTVFVPPTCAGWEATIVGTAGADVLTGTSGPDVIVAGAGRDTVRGGGGHDTICAGGGNDTVAGGGGGDLLIGDFGNDHLDGGPGADLCDGGPDADDAIACEATVSIP
jgi:subtilisin-like proprotein convertase family protein